MAAEGDIHERMGVDPNSVIEIEVEVIGYIDENGSMQMKFRCDAEHSNYSTVIGLVEQAKTVLVSEWMASE